MTLLRSFLLFVSVLGISAFSNSVYALDEGAPGPDVVAVNHLGQTVDFKELYKSDYLLVFFYPRANTPGCTAQNKSLRDNFKALNLKGVKILGVSTDSVAKQKDFHTSLNLPFPLISDEKEAVAKAFGVPVRLGFASRQAFLIHKGKVIWADTSAGTSEQAQDVLKAIQDYEAKNSTKQ